MLLLMFYVSIKAYAEDKTVNTDTQRKYVINLIWISGTQPPEYIFVTNGSVGFKTIDSLKKFVTGLPKGSILQWNPGCKRLGDEPLLSSRGEMEDFENFCKEQGIIFNLSSAVSAGDGNCWVEVSGGNWQPSITILSQLKGQIVPYVESVAKTQGIVLNPWHDYTFQYQGQKESVHQFIFVNAFCDVFGKLNLNES